MWVGEGVLVGKHDIPFQVSNFNHPREQLNFIYKWAKQLPRHCQSKM